MRTGGEKWDGARRREGQGGPERVLSGWEWRENGDVMKDAVSGVSLGDPVTTPTA